MAPLGNSAVGTGRSCSRADTGSVEALATGGARAQATQTAATYGAGSTLQRAEDRSLANLLATHDYDNRTLEWDEDFEKKVMALKPDDIVTSMRRNLDPAQISIVHLQAEAIGFLQNNRLLYHTLLKIQE